MGVIEIVGTAVIIIVLFVISKTAFNQNKNMLKKENIAYIKSYQNVIIKAINGEKWTNKMHEYSKNGGQEAIVESGEIALLLSYHHTSGVPGVIKINRNIEDFPVNFHVEAGKMYEIYFSKAGEFCMDETEKMRWKTPLYKKFKKKFEA